MRTGLFFALVVGWALLGATCLPLVETPPNSVPPGTSFGVSVEIPGADVTVPEGTVVTIRWSAFTADDLVGTARVYVEARQDLTRTVLAEDVVVEGSITANTPWDTSGFHGQLYAVHAELVTAEGTASGSGAGKITVDMVPTLEFTQPAEDARFTPDGDPLVIAWSGVDPEGTGGLTIGLDPDDDPESGNEIFIHESTFSDTETEESIDWTGENLLGEAVDPGTYNLFALVVDDLNAERPVDGGVRITVNEFPTFEFTEPSDDVTFTHGDPALTIEWTGSDPEGAGSARIGLDPDNDRESGDEVFIVQTGLTATETAGTFAWDGDDLDGADVESDTYALFALVSDDSGTERAVDANVDITVRHPDDPEEPLTLGIVSPDEDTTFLTTEDSLEIEYSVNEFDDVLINLKIDTDDVHTNGNEATILSQELVPGGTETDAFEWDGTLVNGTDAPDGIYRLYISANTGGSSPETADGAGLVFRRSRENQPLIAVLMPASARTVDIGQTVTIEWRDDDPTETATIRLAVDDDPDPAQGEDGSDPEDIAEIELVRDLDASGDGNVFDRYFWAVDNSFAPGTYYVFAYIVENPDDPGGDPPEEQFSVAPSPVIIQDPAE